jgi:hypothetical protein
VSLASADDDEWRIDVPMRSFQGGQSCSHPLLDVTLSTGHCAGYYPQLIQLYRKIGVQFSPREFTYSFTRLSQLSQQVAPNFIYNGKNGTRGVSLPSTLQANVSTWIELMIVYMSFFKSAFIVLGAYLRLLYVCMPRNRPCQVSHMNLQEWTTRTTPRGWTSLIGADTAWLAFVSDVLVPLFSAVCTAPAEDIWQHPVEEILGQWW